MRFGRVGLLLAVLSAWPADARAEILLVPFLGGTFAGQSTLPSTSLGLPPVPSSLSKSLVFGVAGLWQGPGIFGIEGEVAYAPKFFDLPQSVFVNSYATTVGGSIIATVPLSVTRESLRPYVVGGLGLLHVGISDRANLAGVDRNLLALNLGGGAIGMLTESTGLRFDLRHTRSVRDDQAPSNFFGQSDSRVRLSYWRATVGVTIRY